MQEVTLTICLTLRGPILSHSTSIGAIGIDAPMARDRSGAYYLPFSLVRGRLRQSWSELNEATDDNFPSLKEIDDLLGPPPGETLGREPQRGRLHFLDFRHGGAVNDPGLLHRIRIDTDRGAVAKGAMQVIESPFSSGELVSFKGTISYRAPAAADADRIEKLIDAGLRWTTNFGGERTVGFGQLIDVEIQKNCKPIQVLSVTVLPNAEDTLFLAIRPCAPFCVAKRRTNPNLFESDTVLSGGVLRGALATTLQSLCGLPRNTVIGQNLPAPWQELGAHFNHIRFTHAFPAPEHVKRVLCRPVVAPLSLVKDKANKVYDVALCAGPELVGSPPYAPSFAVDWKRSDDVEKHFGWATPDRELRVRTAMERDRRRAKDENLFAYEMVVPAGCVWYSRVDLKNVPASADRAAVAAQLRALLNHGLYSLGKTKAQAQVEVLPQIDPIYTSDPDPMNGVWVVSLQTPALLCDPSVLNEGSGGSELFATYEAAWRDASQGTLHLSHFFASQSLAGGYLALRFQRGKPYNPFLLTDPGSVFVLQASGTPAAAQAAIKRWLQDGLPLPEWAQQRYGTHWSSCPFLPTDGFGEIAVNLFCHQQPLQELFHGI